MWNVHFYNAILCLANITQNWRNLHLWMDTMDYDDLGCFCFFFFFGVILFADVYAKEQHYWCLQCLVLVFGQAFFNSWQKWEPCNWFQKCTTKRSTIYGGIANGVWNKVKYHSFACWARDNVYVCVKLTVLHCLEWRRNASTCESLIRSIRNPLCIVLLDRVYAF